MSRNVRTEYYHRPCGTWLFTRHNLPFFSGEVVKPDDVVLANGEKPLMHSILTCTGCPVPVRFHMDSFRVLIRED